MKLCKFCKTKCDDSVLECPSCGAKEFSFLCSNCGTEYKEGFYCPKCGVKVDSVKKHCPKCSTEYFTPACPNCGYMQNDNSSFVIPLSFQQSQNDNENNNISRQVAIDSKKRKCNKIISLILCIFFGYIGAHKFYEGKIGIGILYLFTAGLFCIGWIVDICVLLTKPNEYDVK